VRRPYVALTRQSDRAGRLYRRQRLRQQYIPVQRPVFGDDAMILACCLPGNPQGVDETTPRFGFRIR
jgi:hypothetical protein